MNTSKDGEDQLTSINAMDINGLDCPACGHPTLMLMTGNYITCSLADCPNPDYSAALEALIARHEKAARVDENNYVVDIMARYFKGYLTKEQVKKIADERLAELTEKSGI